METIEFEVTLDDVERGDRRSGSRSPFAMAIQRALGTTEVDFWPSRILVRGRAYHLTPESYDLLCAYDDDRDRLWLTAERLIGTHKLIAFEGV